MKRLFVMSIIFAALILSGDKEDNAKEIEYVGTNKCKICHRKSAKGEQYKIWEAGKHINSYETLKNEHSAEIAKKMGIKVPAYEAPECLSCHVTGWGVGGFEVKDAKFYEQKTKKGKPTKEVKRMEGLKAVGCESCHGAGSEYKSKKVMKKIFVERDAGKNDAGKELGYILPDEDLCKTCHNKKSPTYKEFIFKEKIKDVNHPIPAAKRAELLEKYKKK